MKFILSAHAEAVMSKRNIPKDWIFRTIAESSVIIEINNNETHYFLNISEYENRCLKVVINPIKLLVVTAYFDRKAQKKGCK